ncbi:hypothetical protein SAMN05216525_12819 [Bradyrhizobium sp. Gha]|nr:hypothetical protein SAMN05216525_12819 [Bradyrhizobium sp. Gha]
MIFGLRRRSNSAGEATATVGTPAGGAAPAGIGVALTGGAARAGVVLPAGMDGGTQAAPWLVRRSRGGRESSVHDRSPTGRRVGRESGHCLTGSDGLVFIADLQRGSPWRRWVGSGQCAPAGPRLPSGLRYVANAASIAFRVLIVSSFASNSTSLQRTISPWAMSCFSLRRCARPIGRAPAFRLAAAGTSLPHTV